MLVHANLLLHHALLQMDVLVEGFNEDGQLCGRSQYDAPGELRMAVSVLKESYLLREHCLHAPSKLYRTAPSALLLKVFKSCT